MLVFPEGGTFEGDVVAPFKAGAFVALRGIEAEVWPVGLAYDPGVEFVEQTFMQHMARVAGRPRTRCAVRVGEAWLAERLRPSEIAERMHGSVQTLVHAARTDWERWQAP